MTDDELAARLYPSMQPDTYDPSKHPAISAEVREIRNQPERQLYKARDQLGDVDAADFGDVSKLSDEKRAAVTNELREIFSDLGMGHEQIGELKNWSRNLKANPVPVERQRDNANRMLRDKFGAENVDSALAGARKLLQRDPRTARLIESMGLGDDGDTVLMIATEARRQRAKGLLK
ncbi:MAG TPA: hypothetical protein PLI17_15810 [Denitromonas sp.]|nr:hypothetical protein [Denitromonas sp.]